MLGFALSEHHNAELASPRRAGHDTHGTPYTDLGAGFYASRESPQARQDYLILIRQLQKLNPGSVITITPAEAA